MLATHRFTPPQPSAYRCKALPQAEFMFLRLWWSPVLGLLLLVQRSLSESVPQMLMFRLKRSPSLSLVSRPARRLMHQLEPFLGLLNEARKAPTSLTSRPQT